MGKVAASLFPGVVSLRLKQRNEYRVPYAFSDIAISFLMAERFVAKNARATVIHRPELLRRLEFLSYVNMSVLWIFPVLQFRDLFGLIVSIDNVVAVHAARVFWQSLFVFVVQTANYMK